MRRFALTLSFVGLLTACGEPDASDGPLPDHPTVDQLSRDPSAVQREPDAPLEGGQVVDVGEAVGSTYGNEDAENDEYGRVFLRDVTLPGDLDGDGNGDVLLTGAWFTHPEDVNCEPECDDPLARLYVDVHYGGAALRDGIAQVADARIVTPHVARQYTGLVRAVGDVDGDGKQDLLIGARSEGCEQGDVYLVYGGARLSGERDVRDVGVLIRERTSECMRFGVPGAIGDIDGDGFDDFAIGAPASAESADPSAIFIYYGSATRLTGRVSEEDAAARIEGVELPENEALTFTHALGDVDGDGFEDFLVSTHRNVIGQVALGRSWGENGASYLMRGGAERFTGAVPVTERASIFPENLISVAGLSDLDGDGMDDVAFVIGDANGPREGIAHIFYGRAEWPAALSPEDADAQTPSRTGSPHTAFSVARAGDIDGDGHADLLYGDPSYRDVEGAQRGAVHVVLGGATRLPGAIDLAQSIQFVGRGSGFNGGEREGRHIGSSMAGGSDLDGDGHDDLVIVRRTEPRGGIAYFWFGQEGA